jgi:hypothetical protein
MIIRDQQTIDKDGILLRLPDIERDCWEELEKGCLQARHPFHQPAIATVNYKVPEIRTVVLRKVIPSLKQLHFHTDRRSGKYKEIMEFPNVSWLFYDFGSKLQIRINAVAVLHTDDADADGAWDITGMNSRKTYMIDRGPSTISARPTSGLDDRFIQNDPTEKESETGRKNFCLVKSCVNSIDWLWLNSRGHKRAKFKYVNTDLVSADWLIP